ncbi:putative feruloyl esterase [Serendipita vermifera]|nr:putative feruloyl esterase [Serendipita vermifera]
MYIPFLLAVSALALTTSAQSDAFKDKCSALANNLTISTGNRIEVNFAQFVAAGTTLDLAATGNNETCTRPTQTVGVDLCRLAMEVGTSNSSSITMEAWMPRNYTGRFLSTGNGGLGGCIQYEDLAYTAGRGFSAVATNNGHNGTSGGAFFNQPEVITDFAWRAVYTGVVVGKDITDKFYDAPHRKSYYFGCSTGGGQGWKMVQDFPDLFDGVVVGAPALAFNGLIADSANFYRIPGDASSPTFLPPDLWETVHQGILDQCDELDGLKDGILEDPDLCQFDPTPLLCYNNPGSTEKCLTPAQAIAVLQVFSPVTGANGEFIYPRMNPGSEIISSFILYNGQPFSYSAEWFKYVVYNDSSYDPTQFSLEDASKAVAMNPSDIQTFKGDLSKFRDQGGKILHWHGLADFLISSDISSRYYHQVLETMNTTSDQLDNFYRYFRVSGTGHCSGGEGATKIGQNIDDVSYEDSPNNILARIVDWVENGNAPETIRGTKFVNDTQSLGVSFARNHCKYPARNVYHGDGVTNDETQWTCIKDSP